MQEGLAVEKVWGTERYITNTALYCAKRLTVRPGYICSEHRHDIKTESFYVEKGTGIIALEGFITKVNVGDLVQIPRGRWHAFATATGMELLEVSTHHEDSDVERQSESHQLSPETDPAVWEALYR